jgi:CubicO group peptidase (beta-lactamase class C family)
MPMETTFRAVCEAAAEARQLPALVAGYSVSDRTEIVAVGCEADTRFRIASLTKPLTATLVTALLDPGEPVELWGPDVRLRHLLSHTSGYPCELGDLTRFGSGDNALTALAAELGELRPLVPVETAWSYANTGYWLAGWLAAERAGTSYEDALARLVLGPARLDATAFDDPDLVGEGPDADGRPYPRARRPSGGLVANVHDVLRFGAWHLASAEGARLRTVHGRPPGGVYGLGLGGERVGGIEVWGHGGSYGGFRSTFRVVPDATAALAALTNASRGEAALREIEDAFFETVLGARRATATTVALAAAEREAFVGTYAENEELVSVEIDGDGLRVTDAAGSVRARPIGERTFEVAEGDGIGSRLDFPLEGFLRRSSLAPRVS